MRIFLKSFIQDTLIYVNLDLLYMNQSFKRNYLKSVIKAFYNFKIS